MLRLGVMLAALTNSSETNSPEERNCTPQDSDDFPEDLFSREQRQHGALLLHVLAGFFAFSAIAIVCRDFFLPSVHCICHRLHISKDVAGATFMAMATSMPEMFVNIIGTFLTESDLGVGTIVGSAVYNTLAVVGIAGMFAPMTLPLAWWPLTRDCLIYLVAIGLMTAVLWDSIVHWYEALFLLVLYFFYLVIMYFNNPLHRFADSIVARFAGTTPRSPGVSTISRAVDKQNGVAQNSSADLTASDKSLADTEADQLRRQEEDEDEEWVIVDLWHFPGDSSLVLKLWWLFSWPINLVYSLTIPDCRPENKQHLYPFTFVTSVVFIGMTSYLVSWMITIIGDTFYIPSSVMGLVFVAAGGDVPETVSSTLMVLRGVGSMGLSNSMGANTLDILLCLSLPWLIKCLLPSNDTKSITIISHGLTYNCLFLFGCVVFLYSTIALFRFRMTKKLGMCCFLLYLVFITLAVLLEMNVLFQINLPVCES
ncbi:sodium/potassium/calcium exchanger 4-like [Bacillus rossius redtenbacheri]|uniref:sodium/potassium/calcium exchanger 4-like n=1 Tax=Bacillus rossius redtenbacheri TaxID=93214 RepID=UPI002FDDA87A